MYSSNFNTTLNVLKCSTIYFSTIQLYICFKMFMTCMMRYVILAKMKTTQLKSVSSKATYFSINWGGGGLNKYLHLKRGLIREGCLFERGAYLRGGGG